MIDYTTTEGESMLRRLAAKARALCRCVGRWLLFYSHTPKADDTDQA